jgi:ribose 5-phosphate isomerase B
MATFALGADHAGHRLKEDLKSWLADRGHGVTDCGTHSEDPVDYPDFAEAVAHAVTAGAADRGILVCGTGVGMAIAANKVPGIRAALCQDPVTARMSREHNDANVLALGARILTAERAIEVLDAWLGAQFAGGRHARRVEKVMAMEQGHSAPR